MKVFKKKKKRRVGFTGYNDMKIAASHYLS